MLLVVILLFFIVQNKNSKQTFGVGELGYRWGPNLLL